ncbi:Vacuolar calcium ion transporter [Taphrina deformans PYCC 5710]|uniref:Vacuolar calcium ion transporter n=1 Tax=Taphrina deformans (strain PYCC 5710 / ATCC 11124 / CBS 356.35 / IMI 108563 / JCM 9778 / NBRC 8474) TaxID=1097556 RepID=R4XCT6_TAPDE|nr:Vacuolar calcium ion transporter [Taphrina deformans PYCC 5710]|eukprot:CCG83433.1 Vacuolar calcium ion transporter [Taphrina deformans PYCC 5710]
MLGLKSAKRSVSMGVARTNEAIGERSGLLSSTDDGTSPMIDKLKNATRVIFFQNYVNVLLVFVPLGILAELLHWSPAARFTLNFFAIIPLASLLSFATEELALQVGQSLGGLLNASFGNAVELIVSVIALTKGELRIVQASMLGSILSNILLVLGMCFAAGGFYYQEQEFNMTVAQTMSSLMAVGTTSLLLPAAFHLAVPNSQNLDSEILFLSRGTAVILLVIYCLYLFFQLKTHASFFDEANENEDEEAKISPYTAGAMLVVVTVIVAFCADFLVGSIDEIVSETGISKTFVGLILIPIVGNAAEHVTAVVCSVNGKMDLAIGVSLGSAIQISIFMTPFLVVLGWAIGQPMTLYFKSFETITLFVAVLVVNYLLQDGKSNWLEGAQLMATYIIIAIAFYIYPDSVAE